MKVDDLREMFLAFFHKKGHTVVASDSLAPGNDPTLLFTGAGMNQFKENFLGLKKDLARATTAQKCLRTGDLDAVGRTSYHHSFFEMLGNFSFGDYFKREAIEWAWEFLTAALKIPAARLRISVHTDDHEALKIWREVIGIPEDRIYRLGDKTNFWPANAIEDGPNGPCGPCSEIYYDTSAAGESPGRDLECGSFAEIWNLVFTQFDRRDGGALEPLASKNIDTGMGLERLACVMQSRKSNFEIDTFVRLHEAVSACLGLKRPWTELTPEFLKYLFRISDHVRAVIFALSDGILPSNEGRGYVIRKLIRRALWNTRQLHPARNLESAFLYRLVPVLAEIMRRPYPELGESEAAVAMTLRAEEEKFLDALEIGLRILKTKLAEVRDKGLKSVPGDVVFELYDTYGFPDELTRMIADSEGLDTDTAGFETLMAEQRRRAKEASPIANAIFTSSDLEKKLSLLPPTEFLGYRSLESDAKILLADICGGKGTLVLDQTPFYGESGGQAGDRGTIVSAGGTARVLDTQKKDALLLHHVEVEKGSFSQGDTVKASVDVPRREAIRRNHTATHLLHAALRSLLGPQVRQLGSYVGPDKLRFDYAHGQALTADQIRAIEDAVNGKILQNLEVAKDEMDVEEARGQGALAFFGEKYGKTVRVVTVPGFSKELCGGTHCERTGDIGLFLLVSDSSIASGTRRIEAMTGMGALAHVRAASETLSGLARELKTTPAQVPERISKMRQEMRRLEKERTRGGLMKADGDSILRSSVPAGSCSFSASRHSELSVEDVRGFTDQLRSKARKTVFLIVSENAEKIHFVLGMSPDLDDSLLDLRALMKELSPLLGASGGGRKNMVQGGARNAGQLETHWDRLVSTAVEHLSRLEL